MHDEIKLPIFFQSLVCLQTSYRQSLTYLLANFSFFI